MPRHYICGRASNEFEIDGDLNKPVWQTAAWTEDFLDIQGAHMPAPRFKTRAKMLWDDENLYIGAEMEEPQVWATLTTRDSVIFHDNDFEVFIDPDGDNHLYVEFEMNALNTVWDLLLAKPYRDGGPAINGFDIHGIKTGVKVDGVLNDPTHVDNGWSVEIAIPWSGIADVAGCACPPKERDRWRINFSRVEWHIRIEDGRVIKTPNTPEDNWVWSPQGVVDMHRPEEWGVVQFTRFNPSEVAPILAEGEHERAVLMKVYYAQRKFVATHSRWATHAAELEIEAQGLKIWAGESLWEARLGAWSVDNSSRLWKH